MKSQRRRLAWVTDANAPLESTRHILHEANCWHAASQGDVTLLRASLEQEVLLLRLSLSAQDDILTL